MTDRLSTTLNALHEAQEAADRASDLIECGDWDPGDDADEVAALDVARSAYDAEASRDEKGDDMQTDSTGITERDAPKKDGDALTFTYSKKAIRDMVATINVGRKSVGAHRLLMAEVWAALSQEDFEEWVYGVLEQRA